MKSLGKAACSIIFAPLTSSLRPPPPCFPLPPSRSPHSPWPTCPNRPRQRLWFKTNLKLAKLWLDRAEYGRLTKILKPLHQACRTETGEDDARKGTQLLEIYALEIQMHTAMRNNKRLKVCAR